MSHIAAALAKSKGKAVNAPADGALSAPLPPAGSPDATAPQVEASANRVRLIALVAGGAMLLAGGAWWWLGSTETPPPKVAAKAAAVAAPAPALAPTVAANKEDQAAVTRALAPAAKPAAPEAAPASPAGDAPNFFDIVKGFSISAVQEGPTGRAMINGKPYKIGSQVVPGLWLREISQGRVIFRDANDYPYTRRF